MNRFKKAVSLILAAVLMALAVGCGDSYKDAVIYFEIPERPLSLDPQTASTDSELVIVGNIFEGLLRKNASGAIVSGVCKSYSKSGLTYTFNLRDDLVWSNEEPLTAADFVFGLRRAVSPTTKAPFVSRLFCIENAKDIFSGKKAPSALGVAATDENTLTIKLSYEDKNFEEALTSSIAMPCNEKFFNESAGKYGLSDDYILSCGSYRLTKWNKENFGIRIYSNSKYNGSFEAKNSAVYITNSEKEEPIDRLIENNVDIAFIDSSLSDIALENNLKTIDYQNICWFLTIGPQFSTDLRTSFAMLIGNEVFGGSLKSGYSAADSVFPDAVYKDAGSSGMTFYDIVSAKNLFSKEIDKLKDRKFPSGVKLYYYDNGVIKSVVTDIVGHWQNNLGAFINIEPATDYENITSELKNRSLTMAIFPVRADSGNLAEYLSKFGVAYNGEDISTLQTNLLRSKDIFPIAFQNTTIAHSKALNDVFTKSGGGYIDFSFIVKTE